jgi:hypothetical protein
VGFSLETSGPYGPEEKVDHLFRTGDGGLLFGEHHASEGLMLKCPLNEMQVIARWNNPGRGMANPTIPNRTIWTDLYDQKARTLKVKFYLKDGPIDPETGDPKELVYSELFMFKLQKQKSLL